MKYTTRTLLFLLMIALIPFYSWAAEHGQSSQMMEKAGTLTAIINTPSSDITLTRGEAVILTGTVTGGAAPYTYWWEMGGEGGSPLEDPGTTIFTTAGIHTVIFYVKDSLGVVASDTVTVTVQEKSGVDLSGNWRITMEGIPTYSWNAYLILYPNGTYYVTIYINGSLDGDSTGPWSFDGTTNICQFTSDGSTTYGYGVISGTLDNFTIPGYVEDGGFVVWRFVRQP